MRTRESPSAADLVTKAARSGTPLHLRVGNGTPIAELWLDSGKVTAAVAEGGEHRLGARLVATGHLRAGELGRVAAKAATENISLQEALSGRVRRDVLDQIARDEARYAMAAALAAPQRDVEAGSSPIRSGLAALALDAHELLEQTLVFLDAVRAAQQTVPADAVLVMAESPGPGDVLAPEEMAILARADGLTPVSRIAEACGFPHPEVSLIAERLVRQGFVAVDHSAAAAVLLAELEAAQDLEDVSAAFEAARAVEDESAAVEAARAVEDESAAAPPDLPLLTAEPVLMEEPVLLEEPVEPLPIAEPVVVATRADSGALLRELASIARGEDPSR